MAPGTDDYELARVHDALAHDERTAELSIEVHQRGDVLVLTGTVATEERRDDIAAVVAEVARDTQIRNEIDLVDLSPPTRMEPL
jgi:osmotically-inducible protein OsmY